MDEAFEIPVTYKGEEISFMAVAKPFGYIQHIVVDINGTDITIEKDEEGNYRALVDADKAWDTKLDVDLIKAVVEVLASL